MFLSVGLVAALVVHLVWSLHGFDLFEGIVWDLRAQTLAVPSKATDQIDVIVLDQGSLDWAEQDQGQAWPWPREYFGVVARYLAQAQIRALVFDVIFEQPSTLGGDDQKFADAIRANGRVVLAESLVRDGSRLVGHLPTEALRSAAAAIGEVLATADADGTNRRVVSAQRLADGTLVPGLAAAAWSVGTGRPVSEVGTGDRVLRYRGPQLTHRTWTMAQILRSAIQREAGEKPDVDPGIFRGHYVFLGYSAQGLMDLRPSPVDRNYPGVYVHATALDNVLAGDTPQELPWFWEALLVAFWSLTTAFAVAGIRRATATAPVFLLAVGLPVAAGWIAYAWGWWWPVVPPVVAALVSGLAMLLINYALEGRQKRFIQNAFGQYLSPQVIERLVADPDQLKLGGEKRCLSIFFSDVAGFTSISEHLDPVGLTSLLNDYLSEMTSIIYAHGGTIDKYEGDAIIAFWNAPLDLPDHALQAVRASLACQKRLAEIQPRLVKQAGRPVTARIGLNTGDVVIGNMGSSQRFNYTFLGDAGNLASRLEGINKLFGTQFLVSSFTKDAAGEAPDLAWREIGRVRVVGKNVPVTVFEPLALGEAQAHPEVLQAFDKALRDWYGGAFAEALAGFESWASSDAPSRHYAAKTRELMADPPTVWEVVWDAKEK